MEIIMRKWITVVIGLLLVGGSAFGFAEYMKTYQLDVTMMDTVKPVKMIQSGELITKDMIRKVSIPTVQHMENGMIDANQIIGKRAIVPIGESEEFLSWKISVDSLYAKGNEQYIGFKADFVGAVNNMVRRGDKVDVWVEYTSPKLFNASGQEIDNTQQSLQTPVNPNTPLDTTVKKTYSKLLINGLTVAYVKDQDGKEITDAGTPSGPTFSLPSTTTDRDNANAEHYRQNASGQPSYITFIMSPEQYALFAEGTKEGTIKLGLPSTSVTIGTIVTSPLPNAEAPKDGAQVPIVSTLPSATPFATPTPSTATESTPTPSDPVTATPEASKGGTTK
jgi:hypothetical protein